MNKISIMQGDSYPLSIEFRSTDDVLITDKDVLVIEVVIDKIFKSYPDEIRYENDNFIIPLSQHDTFSLNQGEKIIQARIKFVDNSVTGWRDIGLINVVPSISRDIL